MPNRLAGASSPYLLQHAHNPVDWQPWGPEALDDARRRDRPIFLSIGYSTCYWCHVMERESFENPAIAAYLNEHFVPIKVDREERPDLDELYMAATLIMRGSGGWPLSAFLDPVTLRPFYCGTYFPPEPRHGVADFPSVLRALSHAWTTQREAVAGQAAQVAEAVAEHLAAGAQADLGQAQVADALSHLLRTLDRTRGGFGPAPKFPQPALLDVLLDVRERAGDDSTGDAIDLAVRTTLDAIVLGGLRDHLGGGFHRYAVDAEWTVPHFEKMLYDQAGLVRVLARAARRYDHEEYARAAHEAVRYVATRLAGPGGLFLSAEDAEVDGREGASYLWTPAAVRSALCPPEVAADPAVADVARAAADFAVRVYGLDRAANFRDPHHPDDPPAWVLRRFERADRLAAAMNMPVGAFVERLERVNAALLEARDARPLPRIDDKSIASWNGMMIGALAVAARELDAPAYRAMAERAADELLRCLSTPEGTLCRTFRSGRASAPAMLEDYAAVAGALLELARGEHGPAATRRIDRASALLAHARAAFFDDASGAIFDTPPDRTDVFVRACALHDGAMPSGFSLMLHTLLDLAEITGHETPRERAIAALQSVGARLAASPASSINSVRALFRVLTAVESLPSTASGTERPSPGSKPDPVQVFASVGEVEIAEDAPAELSIVVRIAEGWHVPAADPGSTPAARGLVPFRVDIAGGAGVAAFADYPPGESLGEGDLAVRVYRGEVNLRLALERSGEWRGRPAIVVRYQPCSDRACLAPVAAELDIRLIGV